MECLGQVVVLVVDSIQREQLCSAFAADLWVVVEFLVSLVEEYFVSVFVGQSGCSFDCCFQEPCTEQH